MKAYLACALLLTGCIIEHGDDTGDDGPGPTCSAEPTYTVDTNATIDHEAGVDAGYYAEYDGDGLWHFEWTCDTDVSALGCEFSGSIIAQTPDGGVNATGYQLEADDALSTTDLGTSTEIDFDTDTSSGIDGVDFDAVAGTAVEIDFQINGIDQDDLVFIPSNGAATSPSCMPVLLQPSGS
ncbi:MAG TPA: hypothetical protein VGM88_22195 [Kofleriaceae bacterium]|jgi:hypothetical protein